MLGQFLGDFTRGPVDLLPYPESVRQGIRAHRRADALGDAHPFVWAAKQHLPAGDRRYGGLVMDVLCDYLLHQCWADIMTVDKAEYFRIAYQLLAKPRHPLPPPAQRFATLILDHDLLEAYADPLEIEDVLRRMSQRLRRPYDLSALLPELLRHETELREGFPEFFKEMRDGL